MSTATTRKSSTMTDEEKRVEAASAMKAHGTASADAKGADKLVRGRTKAKASNEDEVKVDTRSRLERATVELSTYRDLVPRNQAKVDAATLTVADLENRITAGEDGLTDKYTKAKAELHTFTMQLEGSRQGFAEAEAEHRAVTSADVTERVTAVVAAVSDPALLADLRQRVGVILDAERQAAERQNESVTTAYGEAVTAGLPTAQAAYNLERDEWYSKPAKDETRTTYPVAVVAGVGPRPKLLDATTKQREGVGEGLLVGGDYVHVVDPDREAALRVCLAVGVDVAALEAAVRQRNNRTTAFQGVIETENLIRAAWSQDASTI